MYSRFKLIFVYVNSKQRSYNTNHHKCKSNAIKHIFLLCSTMSHHNSIPSIQGKQRLYTYFLREELYAVIVKYTTNQIHSHIKRSHFTFPISFVRIKTVIYTLRKQEHLTPLSQFKFFHSQILLQIINLSLVFPQKKSSFLNTSFVHQANEQCHSKLPAKLHDKNTNHVHTDDVIYSTMDVSIHSAFVFLENRCHSSNYLLEGKFDYLIHPEIFVRIIRKSILDTCMIHLTRIVFYTMMHWDCLHNINDNINPTLASIRNRYENEIDNFFAAESSKLVHNEQYHGILMPCNYSVFNKIRLHEFHFVFKAINTNKFVNLEYLHTQQKKFFASCIWFYNLQACHYIRCNHIWKFIIQGKIQMMYLLELRYMRFIKRRMGAFDVKYASKRVYYLQLETKYKNIFLGVLVQKQNTSIKIQTKIVHMLPITCFQIQYVGIFNPSMLLIQTLSHYDLCTSAGYPLSRSNWTTCTNIKIVQRFKTIQYSLMFYYSGCINRHKALNRVEYILRYSCAKTLAFKHKTTSQNVLSHQTKYVKIFHVFNTHKQFWISFQLHNMILKCRVWHLNILNQHRLVGEDL